jgi:Putative amidoligase enzyme
VHEIRYGLEVEVIVEKGRRDGYSEQWVAAQLTQLGVTTQFAGYSHETTTDHWKIVTDASLAGTVDDLCIEVVSPILCGESGLDQFRQMLEALRCLGIATNSTCGFHVHVDATRGGAPQALPAIGTLRGRKLVAHAFCCLEAAFDELVARAENARARRTNRNRYCQSNILEFGSRSRQQIWDRINAATNVYELVERISPDRYYKLNMHNLTMADRADTIEFRQHGGVDDAVAAEAWVRLILGFVTRVVRQTTPITVPPQPYSTEQDLQQLFALVDCPGLQSFYTMERRLFHVSNNVKEWHCNVCHKRFLRSQDLARHASATNH